MYVMPFRFLSLSMCLAIAPLALARESSPRERTCAAIAKETRSVVAASLRDAGGEAGEEPPLEDILKALEPLGTCIDGPGGIVWALVPPQRVDVAFVDEYKSYVCAVFEDEPPGRFVAVSVDAWVPVVVAEDGRRLSPSSPIQGPILTKFLCPSGYVLPPDNDPGQGYSGYDFTVRVAQVAGSHLAAIEDTGRLMTLVRFDGKTLTRHPGLDALPSPSRFADVDGDGLNDLVDDVSTSLSGLCIDCEIAGLPLIALGRPDGTFSTEHERLEPLYRKHCASLGRSPWVVTRRDKADALKNIDCALLFGTPVRTILAGLESERRVACKPHGNSEGGDSMTWCDGELLESFWADGLSGRLGLASESGVEAFPWLGLLTDRRPRASVVEVRASSELKPFKNYRFGAKEAVDGDRGTAWQPAKGKGAWIELRFAARVTVTALDIANGFQRTDALGDIFDLNSRPTSLTLTAEGREVVLSVDGGSREVQHLVLPEPLTTDVLRISVTDRVKGSRWDQVAISEIAVLVKE